jgi:hypothetical protein
MPPRNFVRHSFSLSPATLADLRKEAEARGMTLSEALRHYLRFAGLGQNQGVLDLKREEGGEKSGN